MSHTEYDVNSYNNVNDCPGKCPSLMLRTLGGDRTKTDCAAAVTAKYGQSPVVIIHLIL